jgi:hypothetical protein
MYFKISIISLELKLILQIYGVEVKAVMKAEFCQEKLLLSALVAIYFTSRPCLANGKHIFYK